MTSSITLDLFNRNPNIHADTLLLKKVQIQHKNVKIGKLAKQWNAMRALTNQTVKESFHG